MPRRTSMVGVRLDLVDEVLRHPGLQRVAPHQHGDLRRVRAKWTAACPAELAPPTMWTWCDTQELLSVVAAP